MVMLVSYVSSQHLCRCYVVTCYMLIVMNLILGFWRPWAQHGAW